MKCCVLNFPWFKGLNSASIFLNRLFSGLMTFALPLYCIPFCFQMSIPDIHTFGFCKILVCVLGEAILATMSLSFPLKRNNSLGETLGSPEESEVANHSKTICLVWFCRFISKLGVHNVFSFLHN